MKYARHLSKAMRESYLTLQAETIGSVSLRDELSIFQTFFTDALERYNRMEAQFEAAEAKMKLVMRQHVDDARRDVLNIGQAVRDMAVAAGKLENDERAMSVSLVHGMLAKMCQAVDAEINDPAVGRRIAERARIEMLSVESVLAARMPNEATALLPADDEARMMDSTVPRDDTDADPVMSDEMRARMYAEKRRA